MTLDRLAVRAAACVAVLGFGHAAPAAIFFDNTTASAGGSDAASAAQYVCSSFVAANAATTLTADLLLRQTSAGTNTLRLFSDTPGGIVPDAPIATLTDASQAGATNSLVSFTGSGLNLTAGVRYWLVLSSTGGVAWNYSASVTPRNRWAIYDVNGGGYSQTGDANPYVMRVAGVARLPGDCDNDGDVDFNDFVLLQTNFGTANTTFGQGNFDADSDTDFDDFVLLQTNFGSNTVGPRAAFTRDQFAAVTAFGLANAVPEPAAAGALLAAAGLLRRRRR